MTAGQPSDVIAVARRYAPFMIAPLHGHCACGSVHIELSPPTLFASYCHCESCRRVTRRRSLRECRSTRCLSSRRGQHGHRGVHVFPATIRAFCRQCGTSLFYRADQASDRIYVPVAILNAIDRPHRFSRQLRRARAVAGWSSHAAMFRGQIGPTHQVGVATQRRERCCAEFPNCNGSVARMRMSCRQRTSPDR